MIYFPTSRVFRDFAFMPRTLSMPSREQADRHFAEVEIMLHHIDTSMTASFIWTASRAALALQADITS